MRIVHLITTISRGGAENQLLILAREQILLGHSVTVVPLKDPLDLKPDFERYGVSIELFLHNKTLPTQAFRALLHNFKKYDVVHAHLPQAELVAFFIRSSYIIATRHFGGKFIPRLPRVVSRLISTVTSRRSKAIIAISNSVQNYLNFQHEVQDKNKIKVIQYGFDPKDFSRNIKAGISKEVNIKVGTLSRLSPEKDLQTMIRGFAKFQLSIKGAKATLEIYGIGREGAKLRYLIEELNQNENIRLMGKTYDAAKTISSFDVFVLTSKFEGFGMVYLEAMALEKAIVCSKIPTAIEVLGEEGAALYFNIGDVSDLALKLEDVLTGKYVPNLGSQKKQLSRFSSQRNALAIQAVYEQVIKDKRRTSKKGVR
jgi:glycosyltransferase involved in cell wall biosynthesis